MHADSLGAIADVIARVISLMGNSRFPLRITPVMAREWFDMWNLISARRMQRQSRSFSSPVLDVTDLHPALKIFRAVVERTLDRARRRYLRA